MAVLGLAWLALLVVELVRGLTPALEAAGLAIWAVFVLHFAAELALARGRIAYLRRNWLTVIALAVPALRVFRLARAAVVFRGARGLRVLRTVTSINRAMRGLGAALGRRGFGYVLALTVLVTLAGAAGMYALERPEEGGGLAGYGTALWWTAMVMTTMGSEYWPRTPEGRVLCLLLSLYAFAMLGYVTATLASFFVGRDAEEEAGNRLSAAAIDALRAEIAALRREVAGLERSAGKDRRGDGPP